MLTRKGTVQAPAVAFFIEGRDSNWGAYMKKQGNGVEDHYLINNVNTFRKEPELHFSFSA